MSEIMGSINVNQDYIHPDSDILLTGTLTIKGEMTIRKLNVTGPSAITGSLSAVDVEITGPLTVGGEMKAQRATITGPMDAQQVEIQENLTVTGPVQAEQVEAYAVYVHGPIKIENELSALEKIELVISSPSTKDPFQALLLKAPKVVLRNRSEQEIIGTSVTIEADKVILDGILHNGEIRAEDVVCENGAQVK
jgi:hypothetical protein